MSSPTPFIPSPLHSDRPLQPVQPPVVPMSPPDGSQPMPPLMSYAPQTPAAQPYYLSPGQPPYGATPYPYGMAAGGQVPPPPPAPQGAYTPHQPPPPPLYGQPPPPQQQYAPQYAHQPPPPPPPAAPQQPAYQPGAQPYPGYPYYPGTAYAPPQPLPGQPPQPQYYQPPPPPPPMVYPPPGMPMQPYPAYGQQPYYATPGQFIPAVPVAAPPPAAPTRRAGEKYDLVFKFGEGKSYGPALKPAHLHALGSHLEINGLLMPVTDADAMTRKHIIWNMLFVSSDARLSTDGPNRSWSTGRDEPATFPRLTLIRLISTTFPWSIDVHAHNAEAGVTCGDVIDAISSFLQQHSPRADYEAVTGEHRRALKDAYHHNRSRAHGVPGGRLGEGMRRVDWLRDFVMFGGIRVNDTYVFERSDGAPMPGVLEVICKEQADTLHADDEEMRGRNGRTRSNSRIRSAYSSRHASRSRPVTPGA